MVSGLGILTVHKQIKKPGNVDNITVIYVGCFIFIAKRCDVDYTVDTLSHWCLFLSFATHIACMHVTCPNGFSEYI